MGRTVDHSLEGMNKLRTKVYSYLINSSFRNNYFTKWQANLPTSVHPKIVPDYSDFIRHFGTSNLEDTGLVLVGHEHKVQEEKKTSAKLPRYSKAKLSQAQDLIYDAWDERYRDKRLALARKALSISPYCADAYNLLAEESKSMEERQGLYEKGVRAGRMALGDLFFKEN